MHIVPVGHLQKTKNEYIKPKETDDSSYIHQNKAEYERVLTSMVIKMFRNQNEQLHQINN